MYKRGPDHSDVKEYFLEDRVLRFGHNRLSILDLSSNGNQPMVSSNKRFVIIFNGEIYNHLELRKLNCFSNYDWKSTSDTETLLSLFQFSTYAFPYVNLHLSRNIFYILLVSYLFLVIFVLFVQSFSQVSESLCLLNQTAQDLFLPLLI